MSKISNFLANLFCNTKKRNSSTEKEEPGGECVCKPVTLNEFEYEKKYIVIDVYETKEGYENILQTKKDYDDHCMNPSADTSGLVLKTKEPMEKSSIYYTSKAFGDQILVKIDE